jgi:hypothetical protein
MIEPATFSVNILGLGPTFCSTSRSGQTRPQSCKRISIHMKYCAFGFGVLAFVRPNISIGLDLPCLKKILCVWAWGPTFCATSESGQTRPPSCRRALFSSDCRSSWWSPFDRRSGPPCRLQQCRRRTRST